MRLLNVKTLKLKVFNGDAASVPPYTILSHTWGEGEVTFQDLMSGSALSLDGYQKLRGCCSKSAKDGFEYTWIDTCCIDKTSSAELSESINSMFAWYQNAHVCYAYMSDVKLLDKDLMFSKSRWFRRGWTLQELLAPLEVVFLDQNWTEIGTKATLTDKISEVTGIDPEALHEVVCSQAPPHSCDKFSIAQKMSWASRRETTRSEDVAYCLMGLFGVHMPLLYGEGGKNAFLRLQHEIMRTSNDDSVFAWDGRRFDTRRNVLAPDPSYFSECSTVLGQKQLNTLFCDKNMDTRVSSSVYEAKKNLISFTAPILEINSMPALRQITGPTHDVDYLVDDDFPVHIAVLSCGKPQGRLGLVLQRSRLFTLPGSTYRYGRLHKAPVVLLPFSDYHGSLPAATTILLEEEGDGSCVVYNSNDRYNLKLCFHGDLCGYRLWDAPQIDPSAAQYVNTQISEGCVTVILDHNYNHKVDQNMPVNLVFRHPQPNTNPTFKLAFVWEWCNYRLSLQSIVRSVFGADDRFAEQTSGSNFSQGIEFLAGRIFPLDQNKIITVKPRYGPRHSSRTIYAYISIETWENAQHHPNLTITEGPKFL